MFPRVQGVVFRSGIDRSEEINAVADRYAFPPRLLVGCGVMESNLDEQSERRAVWPDVSAGPFHQTVAWAKGYGLGDGTASPANVEHVFAVLKSNFALAAEIAGRQLGQKWAQEQDGLQALSRYNSPGLSWGNNPNWRNIARGWDASAAYVVEEEGMDWAPVDVRDQFPYEGCEFGARPLGNIRTVVYHHGASATPAPTYEAEMAMLQAYRRLHVANGWCTLSYHLCIGPSGTAYWTNGLELVSYHATTANPYGVGICFLGNFADEAPPQPMLDAAIRARLWVAAQCGQADLPYIGHKDVGGTACPGGWWPEQRDLLAALPPEGETPEDVMTDCSDQDSRLGLIGNDYAPLLAEQAAAILAAKNITQARRIVRDGLQPVINTVGRVARGEEA